MTKLTHIWKLITLTPLCLQPVFVLLFHIFVAFK